ncbi:hypothetical protein [Streptomyces sp. NPDC057580]|uniref:hypothetical protein n=1 Tax=Streptomyces sp. NPDC057580 TaxID=3346173 RepID=UPI0036B90500
MRAAVLRERPFGPQGGLPERVRVDRGKDFLSRTVTAAFNALDVTVEDLPACTPHLKGTVEGLNRAVESMFLAALPGYVRQPRPGWRALPGAVFGCGQPVAACLIRLATVAGCEVGVHSI